MNEWTIAGRTCLVVGGTSEVGAEIARRLVARGAEVLVASPDEAEGAMLVEEVRRERSSAQIAFYPLDLCSRSSIQRLGSAVRERHVRRPRLDVLIQVVRSSGWKRGVTADGIDRAVAANLLGPFLLSEVLLPTLRASAPARIITVSSVRRARPVSLAELQGDDRFEALASCARTNVGLSLFMHELARRLDGSAITVNGASLAETRFGMHPGLARSADTAVWLASSADVASVTGRHFSGRVESPLPPVTYDRAVAKRLWDACEHLLEILRTSSHAA